MATMGCFTLLVEKKSNPHNFPTLYTLLSHTNISAYQSHMITSKKRRNKSKQKDLQLLLLHLLNKKVCTMILDPNEGTSFVGNFEREALFECKVVPPSLNVKLHSMNNNH